LEFFKNLANQAASTTKDAAYKASVKLAYSQLAKSFSKNNNLIIQQTNQGPIAWWLILDSETSKVFWINNENQTANSFFSDILFEVYDAGNPHLTIFDS